MIEHNWSLSPWQSVVVRKLGCRLCSSKWPKPSGTGSRWTDDWSQIARHWVLQCVFNCPSGTGTFIWRACLPVATFVLPWLWLLMPHRPSVSVRLLLWSSLGASVLPRWGSHSVAQPLGFRYLTYVLERWVWLVNDFSLNVWHQLPGSSNYSRGFRAQSHKTALTSGASPTSCPPALLSTWAANQGFPRCPSSGSIMC